MSSKLIERTRHNREGNYYQQALTDLLTKNRRVCARCKLKSEMNWSLCCKSSLKRLQSATGSATIAHWSWRFKDTPSSKWWKVLISQREIETKTDLQWELRAMEKQKGKGKEQVKATLRDEIACCVWQKITYITFFCFELASISHIHFCGPEISNIFSVIHDMIVALLPETT